MTERILRKLTGNEASPQNPRTRAAVGRLSGIVGIICNLILAGGKFAVGMLSGSLAVTADAVNNFRMRPALL